MAKRIIKKNLKPDDKPAEVKNQGQLDFSSSSVVPQQIVQEMKTCYLDYAMSVIVARALPDVRDGLKPVHRRILYAMWSLGLRPTAKFRKSATVVGEVLGKYHPHGDVAVYDSMVRMAQDFAMRYPLVRGQGNFGCFTKETEVRLADGRNLDFGQLIEEHKQGKRNFTFTINQEGQIKIAEIKSPRLTKKDAELVEVILDNSQKIKCTPNHLFMLRDGSYEEARNLQNGQSLMPVYTHLHEGSDKNLIGYEEVYQPKNDVWNFVHHLADAFNLKGGIYPNSRGRIRHHADFNKLNNNPTNIQRMHWREHWMIHYNLMSDKHKNDPIYRAKIAAGRKSYWANPENRLLSAQRLSERNKRNWQNPAYREHMRQFLSDVNREYIQQHPEKRLEFSQRAHATLTRLWQDDAYKRKMHENIIKGNKNHVSNKTGLVKFVAICHKLLEQKRPLTKEAYEQTRSEVYPYGRATTWEQGLKKYFNNQPELILQEVCKNHKVVEVQSLREQADVYDLTIADTHNFALASGVFVHNSMDGDSAAAMRYTEAKLAAISEEMLADIEKKTVDFTPNYDGSLEEPRVMPSKLPNLLLNGSMGIAVGMATSIPPHNLREVVAAEQHLIDNPEASIGDLMEFVKGPDFPTGGIIYNQADILQAYTTGKAGIVMRGQAEISEPKQGDFQIIISEIPYQVNKATLVEKIAELVKDKKLEGIRDLRDESDKDGVRVVLDLKKDAYPKKILNSLYKKTQLQETFHVNLLALIDGLQPKVLNLKTILEEHIKHREDVVRRRTAFELARAKARAHILDGLMIALAHIDEVIKIIKASKDRETAKVNLMKKYKLSDIQATAIVEMKLGSLANLERLKIAAELKEKNKLIKELEGILSSRPKVLAIIKNELKEVADKHGDDRKTKVVARGAKEFSTEDLVPNEEAVVMMTRDGYIKRLTPDTFRVQGRGGKGVVGLTTKEEDSVEFMFTTMTHDDLLFFTTRGRVFQLKAYEIPAAQRTAKGQAIVNFLQLPAQEKITSVLPLAKISEAKYLFFATERGLVKKVKLEEFANVRRSGLIAIKIKEDDKLIWTKPTGGHDSIQLVTAQGQAIHFKESDVRDMGRGAAGVFGIRLKKNDKMVGMGVISESKTKGKQVLSVMSQGFGKRTDLGLYKLQGRGGSGIKTAKVTEKTGALTNAFVVDKDRMVDKDLVIISEQGQVIRLPFKSVSELGRDTQGVRLMRFKAPGDQVAGVTWI